MAAVAGMPAAKRQRLMDEDTAEVVIRRAFDPSAARGFGLMRPERARAIAADVVMRQQEDGLATLLLKCALFRAAAKGKHQVVISVSYELDSTCQSISQALIQKVGRATTRRLATEVLNHSCVISAALMSPDQLPTYVEETFFLPSLILKGATAEFIAAAMQRGVPLAQPRFFEALAQAADQLVVNVRSDMGSNNMRAIKHFAEVIGVDAQSSCFETTACELHVCNRIKAQVDDIVESVGKLYSIGKLLRIASTHFEVITSIERICSRKVRRHIGEGPAAARAESWRLFNFLFSLSSPAHSWPNGKKSQLFQDVQEFLRTVNDRLNDITWVHWCWDSAEGAPCCANQAEAAAKTAAATVNLFVSSGFEAGSLAIFPHMTDSLNKMIAGRVCKRILPRALQFGRQLVEHSDLARASADELGSGLSDMAATHSIRKGRVAQWVIADRTQYILPGVKLVIAKLDALEYALFGSSRSQRRPSVGVAARLTIKDIADPESSPITVILLDLWSMLSKWGPEPEGPWFLLPLCGLGDFDNQEMRHRLRKQAPMGNIPLRSHRHRSPVLASRGGG